MPESWLRGTLADIDPIPRAVLHALELSREDIDRWCAPLTEADLEARPHGLPSVAFQLRHITRSLDRLLTYAEGHQLTPAQLAALSSEHEPTPRESLFAEFTTGLEATIARIRAIDPNTLAEPRAVGRKLLPTTVGGLLFTVPTTPSATPDKPSPPPRSSQR
jgi:DinB superfamily